MELIKQENGIEWYNSEDNIKFRVNPSLPGFKCVYVIQDSYDMSLHLMLYDFLDRCEDEAYMNISGDNSWIITGFKVRQEDYEFFLTYVLEFFTVWNIKHDKIGNLVSESEWFKT